MNAQLFFLFLLGLNLSLFLCENAETSDAPDSLTAPSETSTQNPANEMENALKKLFCNSKFENMANVTDVAKNFHVYAVNCTKMTDCRETLYNNVKNSTQKTVLDDFFSRCDSFIYMEKFSKNCYPKVIDKFSPVTIHQIANKKQLKGKIIGKCHDLYLKNPLFRWKVINACGADMWTGFLDHYDYVRRIFGC